MSVASPLGTVGILVRYWVKGRFTKATILGLIIGEAFSVIFILFGSSTYLSFSNRVGLTTGLSEVAGSLVLALYLVGLIQSGFNGGGLPVSSSDVDYVFTSPVPPREVFAAKILLNSLTTVLFGFPPIIVLYLRFSVYYHTPMTAAILAGLVTLVFLVIGLLLAADITLSLGRGIGERKKLWRNLFIVLVLVLSLLPITLLIPGIPVEIADVARLLPNGLAAIVSVGLVSGTPGGLDYLVDLLLLFAWLGGFLVLGVRMSRGHFYELLEVSTPGGETRWIEKERLWILKSSPVSMRRYVKEVYRARVAPLLIYLIPVTIAVGVPLVLSQLSTPSLLLGVILALPGALEIAGITMAGGMYFASRYGQSSADDILSSQAQELADIRRFLFQTIINLIMVSPIILLVLVSEPVATILGPGAIPLIAVGLVSVSIVFTGLSINLLLNRAGDAVTRREDL